MTQLSILNINIIIISITFCTLYIVCIMLNVECCQKVTLHSIGSSIYCILVRLHHQIWSLQANGLIYYANKSKCLLFINRPSLLEMILLNFKLKSFIKNSLDATSTCCQTFDKIIILLVTNRANPNIELSTREIHMKIYHSWADRIINNKWNAKSPISNVYCFWAVKYFFWMKMNDIQLSIH